MKEKYYINGKTHLATKKKKKLYFIITWKLINEGRVSYIYSNLINGKLRDANDKSHKVDWLSFIMSVCNVYLGIKSRCSTNII